MVMQPGPVCDAYESIAARCSGRPRVVYMTPQGHTFNQHMAEEFAKEEELVILCGHYEGIDERALESIVTDYVSIGDYVLTGGELPAMVVIDSVSRLVPGVLNNDESAQIFGLSPSKVFIRRRSHLHPSSFWQGCPKTDQYLTKNLPNHLTRDAVKITPRLLERYFEQYFR